jgi:aldose 1-epimerase
VSMGLRLASGDWDAEVDPAMGGAILALRHRGEDVLRPAPAGTESVLAASCFPLVPYANRIAHGRFTVLDEAVELPRNFGDHPHSLHGLGWQSVWQVTHQGDSDLALIHAQGPSAAWPWRYECVQQLSLDSSGLSATLTLRNRDTRPMPSGLGFHPYLAARPGDRLTFRCTETWLTDHTQLATHAAAPDAVGQWAAGAEVFRPDLVDHCHGGWDGALALVGEGRTIQLSATGAPFLHLHIPPGLGHVGVEPVSHMPNAVNRPEPQERTGLRILAPDETMTIAMRIALA